jgi:S-DNA-T family DNA segregation ATPase FtsK/SpoIIIE
MDVLSDFGIKGRVCGACRGPLVTAFEFEPAKGTKATRVIGLADDIARLLGAPSGRIAAAPARSTLSIELPNAVAEAIELRDLLDAPAFRVSQAALPLALGKSIAGEPAVADLTRMPHVLVAGAAASNIAMALHAIILSLLYRQPASQCSFMLIDTGRLNFSSYEGIAHLASLTADPARGVSALTWAVHEMGSRLERMGKLGVSTISAYNAKIASAQLSGRPLQRLIQTGFDPRTGLPVVEEELLAPTPMPYLVIAVSELEALMTAAQTDVEQAIEKVGRMGAAVGIHLIVATRHPTADVVTPQIKAGLQSRVSFSLPSKLESRVVLDEDGAEQLLADGDMLYRPTAGALFRIHSPTVSDREVEAVARHLREPWRRTAGANAQGWDGEARRDDGDEDRRYEPSPAAMFDRGQSGMSSHLQRHFGSGREAIDDHMARRRPAWPPV